MNTSATGGYLAPIARPVMGRDLTRIFQQMVVGITGIDGESVRPRWQAEPPNIPNFGDVWSAIGIQRRETTGFAWEQFSRGDNPTYYLSRQEELRVLCSFYDNGVDQVADEAALTLRDGLQLAQNREVLDAAGIGFINSGSLIPLPSLLKQRWLYRVDLPLMFRRTMVWAYPVLPLLGTEVQVHAERADGTIYDVVITLPEG